MVKKIPSTFNENLLNFQRLEKIVKSHDPEQPLFMYMAFQNVHSPVQAPQQYVDKYSFIKDDLRRRYAGMVAIMDEAVGNITKVFTTAGYGVKRIWLHNAFLNRYSGLENLVEIKLFCTYKKSSTTVKVK